MGRGVGSFGGTYHGGAFGPGSVAAGGGGASAAAALQAAQDAQDAQIRDSWMNAPVAVIKPGDEIYIPAGGTQDLSLMAGFDIGEKIILYSDNFPSTTVDFGATFPDVDVADITQGYIEIVKESATQLRAQVHATGGNGGSAAPDVYETFDI